MSGRVRTKLALAGAVSLVALATFVTVPGCGGDDAAGPGGPIRHGDAVFQRLVLRPAEPGEPEAAKAYVDLAPDFTLEGWTTTNTSKPIKHVKVPSQKEDVKISSALVHGTDLKTLVVKGEYDPQEFNEIILQVTPFGAVGEEMRVQCRREGRALKSSDWVLVPCSKEPQLIPFRMPQIRQIKAPFDEIAVVFRGRVDLTAVSRITLFRWPPGQFLPSARAENGGHAQADDLIDVGGELRRGVGLSSRDPLETRFEMIEGAELTFSYGSYARLRLEGQDPSVVVTLSAEGAEPVTKTFDLESDLKKLATWHWTRVDLAAYPSGTEVTARFELEASGPHEALCAIAEPTLRVPGTQAPTVLLITSDTHRADHMGALGNGLVETPALDALAERGVFFEDCYASTNVTNPSHVALMTAKHPRDTKIVNNRLPLIAEATTLAERFSEAGYRTYASASAYHLLHEESGLGQGFDRMNAPHDADRDANYTVDALERWLPEARGEPLFVWLHVFDAHAPYDPPKAFNRKYYPKDKDPSDPTIPVDLPDEVFPPFMKGIRDLEFPKQQYRAEIDFLDQQVGRVLELDRFRDGIVAFTADHGESFGQHGVYWDHAELYPDSVHIPLILAWPDGPKGKRVSAPVSQTDLGRTLLDLAGLGAADFAGRNLSWALEDSPQADSRYLLSAHGFSAAVESGGWLLILHLRDHGSWALVEPRKKHAVELYDLKTDPGATTNLVDEEHDRAVRLRAALIRWLSQAEPGSMGTNKLMSATALAHLGALGYGGDGDTEEAASAWFTHDPKTPCRECPKFD